MNALLTGFFRVLLGGMLLCSGGCGGSTAPAGSPVVSAPEPPVKPTLSVEPPPLTVDEESLRQKLGQRVEDLAAQIGERHAGESWQLAEAADYIAIELEQMGFAVERQGYETEEVAAQNIAVTIPGETQGDQIVVVGAHYDTKKGEDGRVGGSTDAAVLLELARLMQFAKIRRSLRFVFFALGESPHGNDEGRGARQYIRSLSAYKSQKSSTLLSSGDGSFAKIVAFLHVDEWGSIQERKVEGVPLTAVRGAFSEDGVPLRERVSEAFKIEGMRWDEVPLEVGPTGSIDSDAQAFRQFEIPVAVVSGIGQAAVSPETLKFAGIARATMCLRRALGEIAGERPTNDGMLTPTLSIVR